MEEISTIEFILEGTNGSSTVCTKRLRMHRGKVVGNVTLYDAISQSKLCDVTSFDGLSVTAATKADIENARRELLPRRKSYLSEE